MAVCVARSVEISIRAILHAPLVNRLDTCRIFGKYDKFVGVVDLPYPREIMGEHLE
jgi:hypothetical protein